MISLLFYFRRWNPRLQKACRMLYPCTSEPASSTLTAIFRACNTTLDLSDKTLLLSEIEDITWPRRDTKFVFECWKIFHEWAQWTSEIFFSALKDKFRTSKRPCNVLFIIQKQMKCETTLLKKFFGLKGAVYYEAIAMVILSHVKITSWTFTCEDIKFSHESSLGISLVFI